MKIKPFQTKCIICGKVLKDNDAVYDNGKLIRVEGKPVHKACEDEYYKWLGEMYQAM